MNNALAEQQKLLMSLIQNNSKHINNLERELTLQKVLVYRLYQNITSQEQSPDKNLPYENELAEVSAELTEDLQSKLYRDLMQALYRLNDTIQNQIWNMSQALDNKVILVSNGDFIHIYLQNQGCLTIC